MAKHEKILREIQRLIRQHRLRPGDAIPSERSLAKRLGVSYNTVRYANNVLCRQGVICRHHGRGTFLARPDRERSERRQHRRLGLLYVDMAQPLHPNSQQLTFDTHRAALRAGRWRSCHTVHALPCRRPDGASVRQRSEAWR